MALTNEQYLIDRGSKCPNCTGSNITAGNRDFDDDYGLVQVFCTDCKAYWDDTYQLTGYQDLVIPQEEE